MLKKLPKIMLGWEREMLNAKHSAAQAHHADPLPYLCLRGKCMKPLHKKTQRKQPEKTRTNYLSLYFSKLERCNQIKQASYCLQ